MKSDHSPGQPMSNVPAHPGSREDASPPKFASLAPVDSPLPPLQTSASPFPTREVGYQSSSVPTAASAMFSPPDRRLSRSFGVGDLLNPTRGPPPGDRSSSSVSVNRSEDDRADSPISNDPISARKSSIGDLRLPSLSSPLRAPALPPLPQPNTPRTPSNLGLGQPYSETRHASIAVPTGSGLSALPQPHPGLSSGSGLGGNLYRGPELQTRHSISALPRVTEPNSNFSRPLAPLPLGAPRLSTSQSIPQSTPVSASVAADSALHPAPASSSYPLSAPSQQPQSFFSSTLPPTSAPGSAIPTVPQVLQGTQPAQPIIEGSRYRAPTHATLSPGNQRHYSMMTLETNSGPVQVPIDVQAASKVADEKRRRNATASHRFRQRRKEKEQETSATIAKLEAQAREMQEDIDFYRSERDYFHNLALHHRASFPSRPTSPRHLRPARADSSDERSPQSRARPESSQDDEIMTSDRGVTRSRSIRRRTSSYMPPTGSASLAGFADSEPLPPMPDRRALAPAFTQSQGQPLRSLFHPQANPFDPTAPR